MRVKNTSPYPTDRVKKLLRFSFRSIADAGVEVHVKGIDSNFDASISFEQHIKEKVARTTWCLIDIGIPNELPPTVYSPYKRLYQHYPEGVPIENWEDYLIFFAAFYGRYAWQYQQYEPFGKRPQYKYQGIKRAFKRLNEWRIATGRGSIPPAK